MAQIKVLQMEAENSRQDGQAGLREGEARHSLPLPCHFFDYMIGTSAGG